MGELISMNDEITRHISWDEHIEKGLYELLGGLGEEDSYINEEHTKETPRRFTEALKEYTSGYLTDPIELLNKSFTEGKYNQMLFQNDISFISHCMHHLAPFAGKVHFGYIPNGKLIGLSKIPRLIDVLSSRLQIQERLSDQIVGYFSEVLNPLGCGVVIEAVHFCICARGVKKIGSYTRTSSLRGIFLTNPETKAEFLSGAVSKESSLL